MSFTNTLAAMRFLKMLVTPFDQLPAFELGIIDAEGNLLKKKKERKSKEEKNAYDTFTRLVINIKRHLRHLPLMKGRLGSLAAALYLIKEEDSGLTYDETVGAFTQYLKENKIMDDREIMDLSEECASVYLTEEGVPTTTTQSTGSTAGFSGDADSPVAGYDKGLGKKKKRKKENGVDVFEVDSNILRSARISNRKRDKFIKAMGNTKLAKELKQYFKTYPAAPLLLQDESGVMVRLRR